MSYILNDSKNVFGFYFHPEIFTSFIKVSSSKPELISKLLELNDISLILPEVFCKTNNNRSLK